MKKKEKGNSRPSKSFGDDFKILYNAMQIFIKEHNVDLPGAKFKIGQRVKIIKDGYDDDFGTIQAINETEENVYEYKVNTHTIPLYWENELKGE